MVKAEIWHVAQSKAYDDLNCLNCNLSKNCSVQKGTVQNFQVINVDE